MSKNLQKSIKLASRASSSDHDNPLKKESENTLKRLQEVLRSPKQNNQEG